MKKVFLVLAVIASIACFTSCKKTCTCTYSVLGVSTTTEVNLDDYEDVNSCSDLTNINVAGVATAKCE